MESDQLRAEVTSVLGLFCSCWLSEGVLRDFSGNLILDTYSHVRRPHHDRMAELLA